MADGQYDKFTKVSEFVNQLAYLKKLMKDNPAAASWAQAEIKELRFQALLKGLDLNMLENEAYNKLDWKITDEEKKKIESELRIYKYVRDLTLLKKDYDDPRSVSDDELHARAQQLRIQAAMEGIDLRELEELTTWLATGSKPSESLINSVMKTYIAEAYYAAKMIPNSQKWQQAEDDYKAGKITLAEKNKIQAQAHQENQNLRAKALSEGVNLWEIEKIMTRFIKGVEWGKGDYEAARAYIDPLYEAAGLKPTSPANQTVDTHIKYNRHPAFRSPFGETYSGVDMVVFFAFPGFRPIEIGTATTVTVTVYREKKQIRTIGRIGARGFAKGPRTVSGKIIFTVIREHIVERLRREIPYLRQYETILMDELPPFDILISFGNEYGSSGYLVINGVTTVDEQKTMSIEEIFTETIFTYLARDYQPLRTIEVDPDLPYDPLKWYSTSFRSKGSELIGRFQLDDLIISEYANNLAQALPTLKQNETWAIQDVINTSYKSMSTIEQLAFPPPPTRKIFVQVKADTGELVKQGTLKLTFANSAYNDPSYPWETGPTFTEFRLSELDFDTSKVASVNGVAPGLLVIPEHLGAGEKFTVTYSGYSGNGIQFKPASKSGTVADGEHTYVLLTTQKVVDTTIRMVYKKDELDTTHNLVNVSDETQNNIPAISSLTSSNFKQKIQKSASGSEWLNLYVTKGGVAYPNAEIQVTWSLDTRFMLPGSTYDKLDRITGGKDDKNMLTSLPHLQARYGTSYYTLKTNSYGLASIRISELVFWVDQKNKSKNVYYSDLPADVLLYIYAKTKEGNKYVTCVVRKVDRISDP